jgi:hypothetical protein
MICKMSQIRKKILLQLLIYVYFTFNFVKLMIYLVVSPYYILKEEFEDTKGAIRIRISKKNRQHYGQKKKYKRTNNDLQNIHIKLKIE